MPVVDSASKSVTLTALQLSDGSKHPLMRVTEPEAFHWGWDWTADSTAALVKKGPPPDFSAELWLVPLSGVPRKLDVDTRKWWEGGHAQLHPDGRHLSFVANNAAGSGDEVWALENLVPAGTR